MAVSAKVRDAKAFFCWVTAISASTVSIKFWIASSSLHLSTVSVWLSSICLGVIFGSGLFFYKSLRSALLVTVVEVTTSYGSIAVLSASTWLTVKPSFSNLLKAAFNATSLVDGDNPSINWISENIHIVALVPVIIIFIHSLYFVVSRETYDSTVQSSMVQLAFVCLFHFLCGAIISFTFCVLTLEKFIDEYIIVLDDSRRLSVLDILIYTGLCIYIVIICPLISNLEFKMKLVLYLMRPKYLSTSATVSKISESAEPRPIVKEKSCDEKSIRHGDLKHVQQPITESVLIEDPACQYSVFEP